MILSSLKDFESLDKLSTRLVLRRGLCRRSVDPSFVAQIDLSNAGQTPMDEFGHYDF